MADLKKSEEFETVCRQEPTFRLHYKLAIKDLEFRRLQIMRSIGCGEEEAMVVVYEAILTFLKERGIPSVTASDHAGGTNKKENKR